MRYTRVYLDSMGYELAPNVLTSAALEERVAPVYRALNIQPGQLEALSGIRERRWWDQGHTNADGATAAGRKALEASAVPAEQIGALIYGGVCRDHVEPATACAVAHRLGLPADIEIYDVSNACLGVLNAAIAIANRIELGQIRAGMIVSCESAREINDATIDRMLRSPTMDTFRLSIATLTGGSGSIALILTDGSFSAASPRLLGGVSKAAPEHHAICRWEYDRSDPNNIELLMETDPAEVKKHGVVLGAQTWRAFLDELHWSSDQIDKVICHQVGSGHREAILQSFNVPLEKDFSTYEYLGNIGTVSLPLTAALASERGILKRGDRVAFLGIGSGLNCLMLGWEW